VKIASVAEVKSRFSAFVKASQEGPVVVTRNGRPVAVLVAVNDEEALKRLMMAHSPRIQAILEAARQRIQAGAGIPHEEFWRGASPKEAHRDAAGRKRKSRRAKTA
jgi:prevent-host-death family protein